MNEKQLADLFWQFMEWLWLDLSDLSFKDTPMRVAKMYLHETCSGLFCKPPKITMFPNTGENKYDGIILIKDIAVKSLCEHHFQPFIGNCHIAYIPKDMVVGLSKFSRVVDYFARRPQVQERLTTQIFNYLREVLETEDIVVIINSEHFCMKIRWVQEHCSTTTTSKLWGLFLNDQVTKSEFYSLLQTTI